MKATLLVVTLLLSTSLMAGTQIPKDLQIGQMVTQEISNEEFNKLNESNESSVAIEEDQKISRNGGIQNAGQIIAIAKDIVALGEAIYELVQKGKPKNVTEYAAISVIPKDPISKEAVDVFDMEGFSFPVERNYVARIKNGAGKVVIVFSYKVLFSYGGSYNGAGQYLTNVIIVPGSVTTTYGWDFNATMKLSGIMNHGTKANPVAGALVTLKYSMGSWATAIEKNDTIHVTGCGEIKHYNAP
jgi:hypothetical protein